MNPLEIIEKYYKDNPGAKDILIAHGEMVAKKATELAKKVKHLNPDLKFIKEAAILHDIGIFLTNAPQINCYGDKPYICHGYLGRELLEKEGLPKYALVCERHVGVGITIENIKKNNLPLPKRDMTPQSIEEKIICLADKFFSKKEKTFKHEEAPEEEGVDKAYLENALMHWQAPEHEIVEKDKKMKKAKTGPTMTYLENSCHHCWE